MSTLRKHLIFILLIVAYIALIHALGLRFFPFTRREMLYLIGAWTACYSDGGYKPSAIDPYPFRKGCIFLGIITMLAAIYLKIISSPLVM